MVPTNRQFVCASLLSILSLDVTHAAGIRTIDGSNNNQLYTSQGQANTPLVRIRDVIADPLPEFDYDALAPSYYDGIDSPRGVIDLTSPPGVGTSVLPNPRNLSNAVVAQGDVSLPNYKGASDWLWQWGQFIDHDLSLEEPTLESEPLLIPVINPEDPLFNEEFPYLPFRRNDPAPGTGTGTAVPREQVNQLTAYIDGSQVYGSDQDRADFLRTWSGGQMKTTVASNGEILLPFNDADNPFPNANPPVVPGAPTPAPEELFLAGDVRANEQIGLTAVHTLFVREHNRIAEELSLDCDFEEYMPELGLDPEDEADVDEFLYQMARKAVGAKIQAITYNEFLPMLLGDHALPEYEGYDTELNASISNEFANAAYRVGHTLLSPQIQLVDGQGLSQGAVTLRDAFFDPNFAQQNGVESVLNGLIHQTAQSVDAKVIDEVRNFLFAEGNGGLDLAAVNIQRGRDHGLPSYNDARRGLGLEPVTEFSEITSDAEVSAALAEQYETVEDVDLWLGAIAEDPECDALVGELLQTIIVDQFTRTRDGDRFFYENDPLLLEMFPDIASTTLSTVIELNSAVEFLPDNVFVRVPEPSPWMLAWSSIVCCWMIRSRRTPTG